MYGYCGKIVQVNLTGKNVEKNDLDTNIAKNFIGDFGISLRLAFNMIKPGIDPLSAENAIIIGTSPISGTRFPVTRSSITYKYPLGNAIAFANTSMGLDNRIKRAGYDQVVITGRAAKPMYLKIFEDDVDLCDARDLWGKDIYETTDALRERYGDRCAIMAIGQAGENLVKGSIALVNKAANAGRGGLGAVMGSKNLKAVVVDGTKTVELADPERFKKVADAKIKAMLELPERESLIKYGKLRPADVMLEYKGWPINNQREIAPPEVYAPFKRDVVFSKLEIKKAGCPGCLIPCKHIGEVKEGDYKGTRTSGLSLLARVLIGVSVGAHSIGEAMKVAETLNRWGLDWMTFVWTLEFANELYERGIITKEDTEGVALEPGIENFIKLSEMAISKKGIAAIIGDGPLAVIDRFGKECEKYSIHLKGVNAQEDPRTWSWNIGTLGQITNPEGGSVETAHSMRERITKKYGVTQERDMTEAAHLDIDEPPYSQTRVEKYCRRIGIPEEAIDRVLMKPLGYNPGRLTSYAQDFYTILTCFGICEYRTTFFNMEDFSELYSAATGIEVSPMDIKEAGERIWNLFRAINMREGFDRKDDRIPPRWLEPIRGSKGEQIPPLDCNGKPVSLEDVIRWLDEYYEERGWDVQTGNPTNQKLVSLGLMDVAERLKKLGILK